MRGEACIRELAWLGLALEVATGSGEKDIVGRGPRSIEDSVEAVQCVNSSVNNVSLMQYKPWALRIHPPLSAVCRSLSPGT